MRDLEHGEGRDPGGEAGEPHQRQPDEEGEDAAEPRRRAAATATLPIVWSRRSGKSVGQHARLRLERDRHHPGGERADGDEADLAEREHARVADEDVERDDDRDGDERVQEVDLVRAARRGVEPSPTATTSSDGPSELRRAGRATASYALHGADRPPQAKRPAGPQEQDEDDEREDGRRQVDRLVGRQRAVDRRRWRSRSRSRRASPSRAGRSRRRRRRRARRSCPAARSRA